jgi:hypothetical protein
LCERRNKETGEGNANTRFIGSLGPSVVNLRDRKKEARALYNTDADAHRK